VPSLPVVSDDLLSFTCPRCHGETAARWYGPCEECRDTLRAQVAGEARAVEQTDYVPKVNVTPNAVALKDD
jgi:predicted ATP-dependent serine protease